MNKVISYISRHKTVIGFVIVLVAIGATFRWEIREVDDANTGQPIIRHRGIAFPWQRCGASWTGTPIKFHVHQWLCYGLVSEEAQGSVGSIH